MAGWNAEKMKMNNNKNNNTRNPEVIGPSRFHAYLPKPNPVCAQI